MHTERVYDKKASRSPTNPSDFNKVSGSHHRVDLDKANQSNIRIPMAAADKRRKSRRSPIQKPKEIDIEKDNSRDPSLQSGSKIELNSNMDIEEVMPWDESCQMIVHKVVSSQMFHQHKDKAGSRGVTPTYPTSPLSPVGKKSEFSNS